jgi:hypothetical protein
MPRESNIPLFLWIRGPLVLAHLILGREERIARARHRRAPGHQEFRIVERKAPRPLSNKPIEVAILDDTTKPPRPAAEEEARAREPTGGREGRREG